MNRAGENESTATVIMEESPGEGFVGPGRNGKTPFVPQKQNPTPSHRDARRLWFIGGGIVLTLLLFAFSGISHRSSPAQKTSAQTSPTQKAMQPENIDSLTSLTPILDVERSPEQNTDDSRIDADQIARLATKEIRERMPRSLGDVPSFGNTQNWQPAPYQPVSEPANMPDTQAGAATAAESSNNRETENKGSLVFVRNTSSAATERTREPMPQIDFGIDVPPGTRLRARLEAAISTAVHTPVVAVIQYNYEQKGEIVIPAGTKAFGHLETADRSGYLGVRFESLQMPDGSAVGLDAAATDLQLRPLRGKVEGKHTGKNILIGSFAGIGEIAATLVGRGRLNQPLSEDDLLRERLTNNIGQASDQSVASLALTEHVVVSVPAGTEIYVILQKPAKENAIQSPGTVSRVQTSNQPNLDELRQLLQLQRELNQAPGNGLN